MIDFETFTKMHKNVGDLAKLIVAKGFKNLPKVRKIAKSGHAARHTHALAQFFFLLVHFLSISFLSFFECCLIARFLCHSALPNCQEKNVRLLFLHLLSHHPH